MQDQLRSYHDELRPRNAQENAAGLIWPRAPAQDRHQRLPYPHDLLFRNERGLLENASGSGGISHSAYLAKIHIQDLLGDLASWPNKANERPAVSGPSTIYDQIESQVGWKIVSPLLDERFETMLMRGLFTGQAVSGDYLCPLAYLPSPSVPLIASINQDQSGSRVSQSLSFHCFHVSERTKNSKGSFGRYCNRDRSSLCVSFLTYFCSADSFPDWEIRKAEAGRDWSSPTAIQVRDPKKPS